MSDMQEWFTVHSLHIAYRIHFHTAGLLLGLSVCKPGFGIPDFLEQYRHLGIETFGGTNVDGQRLNAV